jgi:hypothetical protein
VAAILVGNSDRLDFYFLQLCFLAMCNAHDIALAVLFV